MHYSYYDLERGKKKTKFESKEYEELVLIVLMQNSNFRCVYNCVPQKKIYRSCCSIMYGFCFYSS